jgi:hypothetical protein
MDSIEHFSVFQESGDKRYLRLAALILALDYIKITCGPDKPENVAADFEKFITRQ